VLLVHLAVDAADGDPLNPFLQGPVAAQGMAVHATTGDSRDHRRRLLPDDSERLESVTHTLASDEFR
jgi:hypothetical protein